MTIMTTQSKYNKQPQTIKINKSMQITHIEIDSQIPFSDLNVCIYFQRSADDFLYHHFYSLLADADERRKR